eukprot:m.255465 g.255465  ORF g.255465 m.255465 type:complete len:51 (+) comp19616_c0_seq1:1399-1551(+)
MVYQVSWTPSCLQQTPNGGVQMEDSSNRWRIHFYLECLLEGDGQLPIKDR